MNKVMIGVVVIAIIIGGVLVWRASSPETDEFLVNIETIAPLPADLALDDSFDVEIGVRDTDDTPDTLPWALCGVIAGTPTDSVDEIFPYDILGNLLPESAEIAIIQDETNESILFPNGGTTGITKTFTCDQLGKDDVYVHYMTSRLVSDCSSESLLIMQNDEGAEKKSISLGRVRCIDPGNPPPPEKAGRVHSPEAGDGIEEAQGGFEYLGPQTIEIGPDGEFIDKGYLERGNAPE